MVSLKKKVKRNGICCQLVIIAASFMLLGCGSASRVNFKHDVEVAPGRWLQLNEQIGKCWFICEWNGKKVKWPGKTTALGEAELPITLREHEGDLFLIVLNREDMENNRYVYLKLNPSTGRFLEILPEKFPKAIATQNMALHPRYAMGNEGRIDQWEILRKLDFENGYFLNTPTADIWIQLETGYPLRRISGSGGIVSEKRKPLIRDYVSKYKPIPLPNLIKED